MKTSIELIEQDGSIHASINVCEDMIKEIKARFPFVFRPVTIDRYKKEITAWNKLRIQLTNQLNTK